jgi:hypothetical protein
MYVSQNALLLSKIGRVACSQRGIICRYYSDPFVPFPCRVTNDHHPSLSGFTPRHTTRDTQLSQTIVAVPPGWYWDKKSSGALETL